MNYVGIDLHKVDLVVSVEDEGGGASRPVRIACRDVAAVRGFFSKVVPFRAVIEASSSYRWLYDLLSPMGEVILAHPLKLRAIVSARAKTDKLDAAMLAKLLRADLVPRSYVPEGRYQMLRDVTRSRARLVRQAVAAGNEVYGLLRRANARVPYSSPLCRKGRKWIERKELGYGGDLVKRELLRRLEYYEGEVRGLDLELAGIAGEFGEVEALLDIYGLGVYSALLVIAEIGDPERFSRGDQVGAYAGLTARVRQSGGVEYSGHISRQGSPWLRWILVQAAMKLVRRDEKLKAFYRRVRRRSGAKIARVAAARKLAVICWVRLRRWHRENSWKAA